MLVLIKGAGDLASGVALRLVHAGVTVVMTETAAPTCVRRTVAFCRAVTEGTAVVEDVLGVLVIGAAQARKIAGMPKTVAVAVDPEAAIVGALKPDAVVDVILAKRNTGTAMTDAPLVVACGPGFTAGVDCHAVVETMRGHTLGRVLWAGAALANTGVPGDIGGFTVERLIRAPVAGVFRGAKVIGDTVCAGDIVAWVDGGRGDSGAVPVRSCINGVLRGLLADGIVVTPGMKAGDVDPRAKREHCFTVSDKALAIEIGRAHV
jgi:xanthine dehydrogenase accessory factor